MEFEKEEDFSEWYHRILAEAELVDDRYPIKGMTVYRRWGMFILKRIRDKLEADLEADGHEPTQFPVLIPEDVLGKEGEHIAGFEEQVFWVTHAGKTPLERKMALRPTSETAMYPMFALWVRSHTDLPVKVHQTCFVYRYETKHTRPLIRGREFMWNEGHTAFATNEDAEKNIEKIREIYGDLIENFLCIPVMVNRRPDWDKFPGAVYTLAFETLMPDGRVLQLATAHNLGQNFSKVFNIAYETESGGREFAYQTSYGPGFGRLLAAVASIHGDERGLVLPPKVAPIQVIIIPVLRKDADKEKIFDYAKKIKERLIKSGVRAEIDESDEHPGAKYYRWEMRGVPVRVEVGGREVEGGSLTYVRRDNRVKSVWGREDLKKLGEVVEDTFKDIEDNLMSKARKRFDERIFEAKTEDDLDKHLGKGVVVCGWCGKTECAKPIESRGTILTIEDGKTRCVVCGGSGSRIKVAKTY